VENVVEVRYAGVGLGRSTLVRDWSSAGAFIGFAEPMPTGTPLLLKGEGIEQAARVLEVIESADLAVAGMRVAFVRGAEAVRPVSAPAAKPAAVAPAVSKPAPVVEAPPPTVEAAPPTVEAAPPTVEAAPPTVEARPAAVEATPPAVEASPAAVAAPSSVVEAPSLAAADAHSIEGEAGSSAGSGKRRRRRR
jgi:hypothetical protein